MEEEYKELYNREVVAARVIEVVPLKSWLGVPTIAREED